MLLLLIWGVGMVVSKPLSKNQVIDLALIYGNVKYYYPTKQVQPYEWNKQLMYALQSLDTTNLNSDKAFYDLLEQRYADMGLHIHLYKHCPINKDVAPKHGKYWLHKGYGEAHFEALINPIMAFVLKVAGMYGKHLKMAGSEHFEAMDTVATLKYDKKELLVQLHDSLWLGLPWHGYRSMPSKTYRTFDMVAARNDSARHKHFELAVIIDGWNMLYHFSLDDNPYSDWEQMLVEGYRNWLRGYQYSEVVETFMAYLDDAHANYFAGKINQKYVPGKFYYIDSTLYYRADDDTVNKQKGTLYLVKACNGFFADSLYFRYCSLASSTNPLTKSAWALARLARGTMGDSLFITVTKLADSTQEILHLCYNKSTSGPYFDHSNTVSGLVNDSLSIYYFDLTNVSSDEALETLRSPKCKAAILDIRTYPEVSEKLTKSFVWDTIVPLGMMVPHYAYPNRNLIVRDTLPGSPDTSYGYTDERQVNIPIVFLCDEMSVSRTETTLNDLQQCTNGIIIGRPTCGTTGAVSVSPVYTGPNQYIPLWFTPIRLFDKDGNRFTGVYPTITVPKTLDDVINGNDEILDAAETYLVKKLTQ